MVRGTAVQDQTELVECVQEGIRGCKERPEPGAGKMAAEPHTLAGKPRNNIGRQGMRKERGQKRINNSKLAYSGLVPMLNTQIEAVNRGGSNEIPVPGKERALVRYHRMGQFPLPWAAQREDYPGNRKVWSPTDSAPQTPSSSSSKESKTIATQLETHFGWCSTSGGL